MPSSSAGGGAGANSFQCVRQQLDNLGYYQPLAPDSLSLVEALLHDLLKSRHDLKACKEHSRHRQRVDDKKESPRENPIEKQSLKRDIEARKVETLDRKIFDMELLNAQAMSLINRLQEESMEKSKKILKLESGINRAKVITKSPDFLKPKIELSSLVMRPTVQMTAGITSQQRSRSKLDLLAMYEGKNRQLDQELARLQKKLAEAQKLLAGLGRELQERQLPSIGGSASSSESPSTRTNSNSAYMFKLIRENERLKERVTLLESARDEVGGGRGGRFVLRSSSGHRLSSARSCEDIRTAVEQSHMMMHNRCLKNQVGQLQERAESLGHLDSHQKSKHIRAQQEHITEMQYQLRSLTEENQELKRRVSELSEIRGKQKSKIDDLTHKQNILLKSGTSEYKKVEELIGYIERQRDIYKNNMEKLLDKLDPGRKNLEQESVSTTTSDEFTKKDAKISAVSTSSDIQVLREIQNHSRRLLESRKTLEKEKSYRSSPYRNISSTQSESLGWRERSERSATTEGALEEEIALLKGKVQKLGTEKDEVERQLRVEIDLLRQANEKLRDEVALWELKHRENEKKMTAVQAGTSRDEADTAAVVGLHDRIRAQQEAMANLESQLTTKQRHLQKLSDDKDELQNLLDDKTTDLAEANRRTDELSSQLSRLDADRVVGDQRMKQCLQEMQRLQTALEEAEIQGRNLRERQGAEKSVAMEVRMENNRLKDQLRTRDEERRGYEEQIGELKTHVQKYVTEVKRIEELFAVREKERSELLEQYKQLSIEIDSAESYGRKMESQVESLQVQLSTQEAELEASQRRLANLEKDLVDLSLANENYRGQVATLSTKVDVTTSQLREARSQTTWINTDLTSIHELAVQLNVQKVELQNQINEQCKEIEALNHEIQKLRDEVSILSDQVRQEREKSRTLKERLEQEQEGGAHAASRR